MSDKPLLFYSQRDANCVQLWKTLEQSGKLNDYIKICVDNNNKIPKMITTVPCIFIKGRPLITGQAIMMFISGNQGNRPSTANSIQPSSRPNFQQAPTNSNNFDAPPEIESSTNNLEGILDFNAVEMGGAWSDKYSFIQENPSPMTNCYQFIDGVKDNQITGQSVPSNGANNANTMGGQATRGNSMFDNRLQQLQLERNNMLNNR